MTSWCPIWNIVNTTNKYWYNNQNNKKTHYQTNCQMFLHQFQHINSFLWSQWELFLSFCVQGYFAKEMVTSNIMDIYFVSSLWISQFPSSAQIFLVGKFCNSIWIVLWDERLNSPFKYLNIWHICVIVKVRLWRWLDASAVFGSDNIIMYLLCSNLSYISKECFSMFIFQDLRAFQ